MIYSNNILSIIIFNNTLYLTNNLFLKVSYLYKKKVYFLNLFIQ